MRSKIKSQQIGIDISNIFSHFRFSSNFTKLLILKRCAIHFPISDLIQTNHSIENDSSIQISTQESFVI